MVSIDELKKRLKKSTLPEEFHELWMTRGVHFNSDRTEGRFTRDKRLIKRVLRTCKAGCNVVIAHMLM